MASTDDKTVSFTLAATDETGEAITTARKNIENLGNDYVSHTSRAGIASKGLGFAARDLGRELGLTGHISRELGIEVNDMASTFGTVGMGLGILTVGIVAAAKIYSHFAEEHQKLREETIKHGTALAAETVAMEKEREPTEQLRNAQYNLYLATRQLATSGLEDAIKAQTDKIIEQVAVINAGGTIWQKMWRHLNSGLSEFDNGMDHWEEDTAKAMEKPKQALNEMVLQLQKLRVESEKLGEKPLTKSEFFGIKGPEYDTGKQFDEQIKDYYAFQQRQLNQEAAYLNARTQLYKSYGATDQEIQQAEMDAFDATTAARYNALKTMDEREAYYSQRAMEREAKEVANKSASEKKKQQYEVQTLDNAAQAFKLMSDLGGKYGRAAFLAYQIAAVGKTIIATKTAAMEAYKEGGPYLGAALAASIIALGAASVASILSQKYDGGGSSISSNAAPVYDANPATGLPETAQTQTAPNFTLIINGKEVDIGDIAKNSLQYIYNNNNSVNGFSVQVERSA